MLTVKQHLDLMKHALGKTPQTAHSLLDTFNQAGRRLVVEHQWNWRSEGLATLDLFAGSDRVQLPGDFGNIDQAIIDRSTTTNSQFGRIHVVSLAQIMEMKQRGLGNAITDLAIYFPLYNTQTFVTLPPVKQAIVFPTPTVDLTPVVTITYERIWSEIPPDGTLIGSPDTVFKHDTAVPNIPVQFERALMLLARAMAWDIENQNECLEWPRYAEEIARLYEHDCAEQTVRGPMIGGVNARGYRDTRVGIVQGFADVTP